MYIGNDENRTANQIYLLYWTVTEISKTKCPEGRVICLTLLSIRVCVFVEKRIDRRVPTG